MMHYHYGQTDPDAEPGPADLYEPGREPIWANDPSDLPAGWDIFHISAADCDAHNMPRDCAGWAVSRDHGSLVVGTSYVSRAQALDAALRVAGNDDKPSDPWSRATSRPRLKRRLA